MGFKHPKKDKGLVLLSESKPEVLHPLIRGLAFSCLFACADDAVVADDVGSDPMKEQSTLLGIEIGWTYPILDKVTHHQPNSDNFQQSIHLGSD